MSSSYENRNDEHLPTYFKEFVSYGLASSPQIETNSTTSTNVISSEFHTDKIYLLVLDLAIFAVFTYLSHQSYKKFSVIKPNPNESPDEQSTRQFRINFIKGLIAANGTRAFSLIIIISIANHSGNTVASWVNYLAHAAPAFIFLSAYMGLVIIISELYYHSINFQNHLVKPTMLMIVVLSNALLALLALITLIFEGYKTFGYLSEFLIGIGYCFISLSFIYFGDKMATIVKNQRTNPTENDKIKMEQLSFKIWLFSVSIGGLFMIKSMCGLLAAFGAFGDIYPVSMGPNLWDFLMFLITEIAPTSLFIIITKYAKNDSEESEPITDDDYEMRDYVTPNAAPGAKISYSPPVQKQSRV